MTDPKQGQKPTLHPERSPLPLPPPPPAMDRPDAATLSLGWYDAAGRAIHPKPPEPAS